MIIFIFEGMFNKEKFTKILYNSRFYIAKIKKCLIAKTQKNLGRN